MRTKIVVGASGRTRRMVTLLVAVAVAGAVLIAQGPALAHDHKIPRTVLMKGAKELQVGTKVYKSSWDQLFNEELCYGEVIEYRYRFPETNGVAAGSKLRVRIFKAQRPDSFEIAAFRTVDENGEPSGEGRLLNRTLERVVSDGKTVAWDAVFSVNRPNRDYYLVTKGHWKDREGCGTDQFAYWSFHVKTRA